jgi:hypothetical protein
MSSDLSEQVENLSRYVFSFNHFVIVTRLEHFLELEIFNSIVRTSFASLLTDLFNVQEIAQPRENVSIQLNSSLHRQSIEPLFKHHN